MNGTSDKAFRDIVDDLERSVLSSQKSVTTSKVTSDNAKNQQSLGASGEVFSWKLKERLKKHFQDLICSCKVSVGGALQKACELKKKLSDDIYLRRSKLRAHLFDREANSAFCCRNIMKYNG